MNILKKYIIQLISNIKIGFILIAIRYKSVTNQSQNSDGMLGPSQMCDGILIPSQNSDGMLGPSQMCDGILIPSQNSDGNTISSQFFYQFVTNL